MRAAMSRRNVAVVGSEAALAIGFEGTKQVTAIVAIESMDAASLLVALLSSDDRVTWTPVGLSQQMVGTGQTSLSAVDLTRRFVKLACTPSGSEGKTAIVQMNLDVVGAQ